jgi:orotidine-5'-phosphate decarboxylase
LEEIIQDGADVIVMGSGIYKEENPREVIKRIKALAGKHRER